jgi:uncharacterized protein (TIGR03435 family)
VRFLLGYAYHVNDSQISGAPPWTGSEHYDIEAKRDDSFADTLPKLSRDDEGQQLRLMVQSLLADRFKLALHHEIKDLPIYALIVAKSGAKLRESAATPDEPAPPSPPAPDGPQARHSFRMDGTGNLSVSAERLDMFADLLSHELGLLVVNKTGLTGNYDFTLKWTHDRSRAPMPDSSGPTILTALQEQLGLKLESQRGPVDTIVIDHVERHSEN